MIVPDKMCRAEHQSRRYGTMINRELTQEMTFDEVTRSYDLLNVNGRDRMSS